MLVTVISTLSHSAKEDPSHDISRVTHELYVLITVAFLGHCLLCLPPSVLFKNTLPSLHQSNRPAAIKKTNNKNMYLWQQDVLLLPLGMLLTHRAGPPTCLCQPRFSIYMDERY